MIIEEHLKYREELLELSTDEEGFVNESLLLSEVMPSILDAKLVDSEEYTSSYYLAQTDKMKVNGYSVNESGERLQLFIVDEGSIDLTLDYEQLVVSTKSHYENQFKRGVRFYEKSVKKHLDNEIQDSSPVKALIAQISSVDGLKQFDVVEVFVISLTSTISLQGAKPQPKKIDFDNSEVKVRYRTVRESDSKSILIKKRLIDLNFLYNVVISQGNREALTVDFEKMFNQPLTAIKAADEDHFESYLCVIPATMLSGLYKEYSTRLLEKNVRSFLQFRGVNKGIRETIRLEPEKFVAYNNGLTITATEAEIINNSYSLKIKSLTNFQIVNGGQTTATIYFTQKDGYDISQVKVMAKINVAKETTVDELEELISNISTFSNAQSRVSKVDLRSRNPQLVQIKSISDSVLTPSGNKWFFERAKGEFNTKLRISGSNSARLKREYPPERRFSKEQLAKYYCAWGQRPFMVKKGGEKVFRFFIEELSGEGVSKSAIEVNRLFYEEMIAKVMIFKKLEKIYGQGKYSMGQLRSAVVPYSISVIYSYTDGNKKHDPVDLVKIWIAEGFEDDLEVFFENLLKLMNELIKKYSQSDDFGEYSKKEELWNTIKECSEIKSFMNSDLVKQILIKYTMPRDEYEKRIRSNKKNIEVDFNPIVYEVHMHAKGISYYKDLLRISRESITISEIRILESISYSIRTRTTLPKSTIDAEIKLLNKLRVDQPQIFDNISSESNQKLIDALDLIMRVYNRCSQQNLNIVSEFDKKSLIFAAKQYKYASIYSEIGKNLSRGEHITVKQVYYASHSIR